MERLSLWRPRGIPTSSTTSIPEGLVAKSNLIGPGTGSWVINSTDGAIYAVSTPDDQRATILSKLACSDTTYTFTVLDVGGFAVDAILI